MQIHDHADRKYRPEPPNTKVTDHRQKRKGVRVSKTIGRRMWRRKFNSDIEETSCQSFRKLYGYNDGQWYGRNYIEEYGDWTTSVEMYDNDGDVIMKEHKWLGYGNIPDKVSYHVCRQRVLIKPPPRNKKIFAEWRQYGGGWKGTFKRDDGNNHRVHWRREF